jgi:hypothetical protein
MHKSDFATHFGSDWQGRHNPLKCFEYKVPFTYDPYYLCDTISDPDDFCNCLEVNMLNPRTEDTCPPPTGRNLAVNVIDPHPFEPISYRTPNEYIFNGSNPVKTSYRIDAISLDYDSGADAAALNLYTTINSDLGPLESTLLTERDDLRAVEDQAIVWWQDIRRMFGELSREDADSVVTRPDQCTTFHAALDDYLDLLECTLPGVITDYNDAKTAYETEFGTIATDLQTINNQRFARCHFEEPNIDYFYPVEQVIENTYYVPTSNHHNATVEALKAAFDSSWDYCDLNFTDLPTCF